jgi:AAA domain/RepB DNA-primase N-terminal domain
MEAEEFLELLWGDMDAAEERGWADLPAKVNGYWIPYPLEWPPTDEGTGVSRRIDQSLRDREDLYFSVARFSERGRSLERVMPTDWLWADLDEVSPSVATGMGLMPTIAVESSPGRYQAYWRLTREFSPTVIERLNRGLTYALGADKGGWDLTQVLRVPGTRNFKYAGAPRVRLLWYEEALTYQARDVWAKVKVAVPSAELVGVTGTVLPRKDIPRKAKQLLWAKADEVVKGEGSHKLWELSCLLAESGLTEDEIYALVNVSVWNKWKGVSSGAARLRGDIRKAMTHVRRKAVSGGGSGTKEGRVDRKSDNAADRLPRDRGDSDDAGDETVTTGSGSEADGDGRLPFISYGSFMAMAMEEPKWLIEDIWTAGSHGIIGGEPKTSKTTLALALALAVASGRDFLGRYGVGVQGPVLMVQEENAPWMMQDRMRKLAAYSGLISQRDAVVRPASAGGLGSTVLSVDMPADVPLWLLNNYGFDLSVEEHRDMLEGYVQEVRPILLILDPLYLIFGPVDANSMGDLQPFLKWVIQLRYTYGCAVMIVHHSGKRNENSVGRRAGQRLIGSATLHGFTDSALYTSAVEDPRDGWTRVLIEREFRSMEPQKPLEMAWHFDRPGSLDMQLEIAKRDVEGLIVEIVRDRTRVTVAMLVKETGVGEKTIRRHIEKSDLLGFSSRGQGRTQYITVASKNGASRDSSN